MQVVFDENIFPFSKLHPNVGTRLHGEDLLLPESLLNLDQLASLNLSGDDQTNDASDLSPVDR
jgi:hypothetical protein